MKCRNLKALGHWPLSQVDSLRPTGLQARTTSNVVPARRTAETPLNSGSSDRFSMHTWKVTASLTSMAAGSTPGHDCSRHAVIEVLVDAWQSWADVYEESSMASWAQRLSRVIVVRASWSCRKGVFCGARREKGENPTCVRHRCVSRQREGRSPGSKTALSCNDAVTALESRGEGLIKFGKALFFRAGAARPPRSRQGCTHGQGGQL